MTVNYRSQAEKIRVLEATIEEHEQTISELEEELDEFRTATAGAISQLGQFLPEADDDANADTDDSEEAA
jgi:predicted RNase H-like nuclease (RuvC/YqgF family)